MMGQRINQKILLIKYFKTKNRGIGKTRNFGIEKSSGKYLMFLDSDDYLETNACEVLYKKAEKENLDLLVFDYYRVEKTCIKEVKIPSFKTSNIKENKDLLLNINLGPCNKIYKSNSIKNNNIKFDEELKYEDTLFVIMAIYNAERFGLAQLHQLRGRVGRGEHQSYCILLNGSNGDIARERMRIMQSSSDGFVISEKDLEIRGPGEFFGTKQHGIPELKIANIFTDIKILAIAQKEIELLLTRDKKLKQRDNINLKLEMKNKFKDIDHISFN